MNLIEVFKTLVSKTGTVENGKKIENCILNYTNQKEEIKRFLKKILVLKRS